MSPFQALIFQIQILFFLNVNLIFRTLILQTVRVKSIELDTYFHILGKSPHVPMSVGLTFSNSWYIQFCVRV